MQSNKIKKSLVIAMGASFAATVSAAPVTSDVNSNPFGMHNLSSGYMQLADKSMEGNCGGNKNTTSSEDQKAAEASCGGNKNAAAKPKINKMVDGNCGEGKCGAGMMKMDDSPDAGRDK